MKEKKPLNINYIKTLSSYMRVPGAWPSEIFGEKLPLPLRVHRATLPLQSSIIAFGGCYHLYDNFHQLTFLDIGHLIITTLIGIGTVLRSTLSNLQNYNSLLSKFFKGFHLMHFAHKGAYFEEMNKKVDKFSNYYTNFCKTLMFGGMCLFNIGPTYNNLMNTVFSKTENYTMEYSVYYSYPGFNPLNYFTTTTIYNWYLSYICSSLICAYDLILFLMIFQTIGHVYILRRNLENFQLPRNKVIFKLSGESYVYEKFDVEENELIRIKLAECIEHHKLIISFTDEISQFFGPMLAFNYFFHMIACCLLLMECSEGGSVAVLRYGPLTVVVFGQLIQMSVIFELLGSVTEQLKESIYYTPWESMNISNQRTVSIILHKMQYKISLKALGLAAVGVNTMMGILKATFSYYTFLISIGDN